jgi:hypothetical protein
MRRATIAVVAMLNPIATVKTSDRQEAAVITGTRRVSTEVRMSQRFIVRASRDPLLHLLQALARACHGLLPFALFVLPPLWYHEEHRPSRNRRQEEADKKHDALQSTPARPQSLHGRYFDLPGNRRK